MNEESSSIATEENRSKTLEMTEETLDKFLKTVSVDSVYGKPVDAGDTKIIPAAQVMGGMGFGSGFGYGRHGNGHEAGEGGGSGGGGRSMSRPVAAVVASPQGVRVEPVIDKTRIAMTAMIAGAFILFTTIRKILS